MSKSTPEKLLCITIAMHKVGLCIRCKVFRCGSGLDHMDDGVWAGCAVHNWRYCLGMVGLMLTLICRYRYSDQLAEGFDTKFIDMEGR